MAESILQSLEWMAKVGQEAVSDVEDELAISPEEIHAACESAAAAAGCRPGTEGFADTAGSLHFGFEWGVRWQREREHGDA